MRDYYSGSFTSLTADCPYKKKCLSANSFKCLSCRHNRGKRDYFEPDTYRPYIGPYEPLKPMWKFDGPTCRSTPYFND